MRQLDLPHSAGSFFVCHRRSAPFAARPQKPHRAIEIQLLEWRLEGKTHDAGSAAGLGSVLLATTPLKA
jgi:hypothetical protein